MNKHDFVQYLRETLIPDLLESGNYATAVDFETACRFIMNPESTQESPSESDVLSYCLQGRMLDY